MTDLLAALPWIAAMPLAVAALADLGWRLIPDGCPLSVALAGLLGQVAAGPGALLASLLAALLLAVSLGLLWRRGWLGGGDAKLLAACALLVPAASVGPMLLAVALCGGVLAAVYLSLRALPARSPAPAGGGRLARLWRAEGRRARRGGPLPYGVAIAAGALLTLSGAAPLTGAAS